MAYFLLHSGQPSARRLMKRVPTLEDYQGGQSVQESDVVIRWGSSSSPDPLHGRVLNTREAVSRTSSRLSMARTLKRFGIRVATRDSSSTAVQYTRHYRVPIFDKLARACFRSDGNTVWLNQRIQRIQENFREVSLNDDKLTTRAVYYAVRALHALGLDHGMVSISVGQKGMLYVQDVVATPILDGPLLELYATAIENMVNSDATFAASTSHTMQSNNRILLGTDMEMMLENANGKMVLASTYLSRKGKVGCDDRSIQFDGKRMPLVELRPDPDETPLGLVNNLRETMVEAARLIPRPTVKWRAGSMPFKPYCTGGHIHFSGIPFSGHLIRVLDNYLGLPLMMVEHRETAEMRRPRYGFLGDVRHKDYGGFEYRTPASFIVDPMVTTAAFCLAYVIAVHHRELPAVDIYDPSIQKAFYRGGMEVIKPIVMQNLGTLRQCVTYERYRSYIEPFAEMIALGRTWDERADVRTAWGVPAEQQVRKPSGVRRRRTAVRNTG